MGKPSTRRILIAAGSIAAVAILAFVSYLGVRLVEMTVYPDEKSKANVGSYSPFKVYNVRRAENPLSGVNFGLALQAPREGDWGVVLRESDFAAASRAGFHYIRVHVRFLSHLTREGDEYRIDPKLLDRLDWVIKNILDRHMIAIIDFYYLLSDEEFSFHSAGEKRQNEAAFLAVWRILADRYKDYPSGLYFELANEPHRPITPALWNEYVRKALAIIRGSGGNNKTRMVVVGDQIRIGWFIHSWDQVNGIEALELPSAEEDPNIMVTFHYYNPFAFTYQGQTYTRDLAMASLIWKGNRWINSEKQIAYVRKDFDRIGQWAQQHHRKVILGEFGVSVYADFSSQVRWTRLIRQEAESREMVWIFWDFFDQDKIGGLYNQSTGAWRGQILDALMPEAKWRYGEGDQSKAYVRQLIGELSDPEWKVRRKAATALRLTGPDGKAAIPALIAALGDEEWQVRRASAEALVTFGPAAAGAVAELIKALHDPEWQVRSPAADALGAIGSASSPAVPALIKALDDPEWQVRKPAADALGAIGEAARPAVPGLITALDDREWPVQKAAVLALSHIAPRDPVVRKAIEEHAADPELQVRQAVKRSLSTQSR